MALNQTFANSLWPKFRGFGASASSATPHLQREVVALVPDTNAVKVKLYHLNGRNRHASGNDGYRNARIARLYNLKGGQIL